MINRGRNIQANLQQLSAPTLCAEINGENFMFI